MLHNSVAIRYAQALYEMAKSNKGGVDDQLAELIKVYGILQQHRSLARALESPTVPGQIKKSILRQLLEKRITATTLYFLYVLVDKNREVYVGPIIEAYKELMRRDRGEVEVHVQTAAALPDATLKQVVETMTKHTGMKVSVKAEVVPELLGGMVIKIGDKVIDGSVRHQLNQMQERLNKASVLAVGG